MATNQLVPKSELFARLRTIFAKKESGMLTLLTDSNKSVLMRFSKGELTSARCRSWDVENTIEALLETDNVKYSYISSSSEDKPPLLPANDFMMMIDPGGLGLGLAEELASASKVEAQEKTVKPPEVSTKTAEEDAAKKQDEKDRAGRDVDRAIAAKMNFF